MKIPPFNTEWLDRPVTCDIQINEDPPLEAVIDTGANISAVTRAFAYAHGWKIEKRRRKVEILTANGGIFIEDQSVQRVKVVKGPHEFEDVYFFVFEDLPYDLVIGRRTARMTGNSLIGGQKVHELNERVKGSLTVSGKGDRERMAHPDDYCPEELLLPIDEEMKDAWEEQPDEPALLMCYDDLPVTREEHELALHTMVAPTEAPRHRLRDCIHKDQMSEETRERLGDICDKYQSCAAQSQFDVGTIKGYDFKIELLEDYKRMPGHDIVRPYRRNPTDQQIIKERLDTLVKQGGDRTSQRCR